MGRLLKQFGETIKIRRREKELVRRSYKCVRKYYKQVGKKQYKTMWEKQELPNEVQKAQKIVLESICKELPKSPFGIC